ncbi:MAG: peptidase A5, partial [Vulcanisaeta sp.]
FAWPYPSDYYLSPVPSMWSFGTDTAEMVYNAHVIPLKYGSVSVVGGPEELGFLNTYFIPLIIINSLNESATFSVYTANSSITLNEPAIITVVPNESRYIFTNYEINNSYVMMTNTLSLTLQGPTNVYVNYTLQYMLMINDPSGLLSKMSGWYNENSLITLNEPLISYLNNGTRLVFNAYYIYLTSTKLYRTVTNNIVSISVNSPYTIIVNWTKQYQVNVSSPVPVVISLPGLQNISGYSVITWANEDSQILILVPRYYVLNNKTRLIYLGSNKTLVIASPLNISLNNFEYQYLVTIYSKYPVNVNGTYTSNMTEWIYGGEVLVIKPSTVFSNGLFLSEPGLDVTINKPLSITVTWHIDYILTLIIYAVMMTVIIVVLIIRRRHEH